MKSVSGVLCTLLITLISDLCCGREELQHECPPWFFYNTATETCECYSSPTINHIVRCTEEEALLKTGYCMTYEEGSGFYVNLCDSVISSLNITGNGNYITLPNNVSDLNDYMCGPMNRQGLMCSQCADGFGLAIFTIGHPCTNCTGVWYGVPLFLFIEFVPITIFYFIVILFHVNITSAPMVAFVFFSQITVSAFSSQISNKLIFNTSSICRFLNILISFYGIWNLDFFHFIIPPFCISHIKPIHITFLHFISAIYPLCLIMMSWACIHLYSRNFKPLVWLRNKLIQKICKRFSISWTATNGVIDTFATFFLLSYAKLVFTSLRTLNYFGIIYNVNTSRSLHQTLYVKPDPSMRYFGKEHLPFAITSVFIFLLVVLPIPLLLALYPIESVRVILFKCPIGNRTVAAINIFVQKFYNCYRDKTVGGRDLRSLVSIYFFLRVLLSVVAVNPIPPSVGFSILVFIYLACSILIALTRPYKKPYMNIIDTLILANLALLSLILSQLSGELSSNSSTLFFYISGSVLASLPMLGLIVMIIYKIMRKISKLPCGRRLLHSYRQSGRNDTELDFDQLIVASREDPEFQDHTMSAEHDDKHSSQYVQVS